jgi:hypothetical protein
MSEDMKIMLAFTVLGPIIYKQRHGIKSGRWHDPCHVRISQDGKQVQFQRFDSMYKHPGKISPIDEHHIINKGEARKDIAQAYKNTLKQWQDDEKRRQGIDIVRPSNRQVHDINKGQ